jgi:hypothetical protein
MNAITKFKAKNPHFICWDCVVLFLVDFVVIETKALVFGIA